MSEYKRECNVRVVCKISTVIGNVESDDIATKYTDKHIGAYEYGDSRLNEYINTFSNYLKKLLIDTFGASHTSHTYDRTCDHQDVLIDDCGNVVLQLEFTQIVFIDNLDDEFEPYEDMCYLVEKAQNSIDYKDVTMQYDIDVDSDLYWKG